MQGKIKSFFVLFFLAALSIAAKYVNKIELFTSSHQIIAEKQQHPPILKEADGCDTEIGDEDIEEDDYSLSGSFEHAIREKYIAFGENQYVNTPLQFCTNSLPLYILYNQLKVYS